MNLNSPLFNRIRIRPSADEPARERDVPACDHPGCTVAGQHRAPKGRGREGQFWRFCLDHVRAYNAAYNYFDGMSDDAVAAFQKDATIGHRPTWAMGVNRSGRAGSAGPDPGREGATVDPFGVLGDQPFLRAKPRRPEPERPRHSGPVRRALDALGLEEGADAAQIKAQYKTLVKRFHPDAHGGDRSFEERFREIVQAHDTLKAAGLC